jgi:hypothetical protein
VYGAIPSIGFAVAVPLQSPKQTGFAATINGACKIGGSINVVFAVTVQLFASVIVTVYVPAHKFVNEFIDCPEVHEYV